MVDAYVRLHKQEKWADRSFLKFKGKCKVLPPERGDPMLQHRLGTGGKAALQKRA